MKALMLLALAGCWGGKPPAPREPTKPAPPTKARGIVMVAHATANTADRSLRWVDLDSGDTGELPQSLGRSYQVMSVVADRTWYNVEDQRWVFHRSANGRGLTASQFVGDVVAISPDGKQAIQNWPRRSTIGTLDHRGVTGEQPITYPELPEAAEIELMGWLSDGRIAFRVRHERKLWFVDRASQIEESPVVRISFDTISDDGTWVAGWDSLARNENVVVWEELGKASTKKSAVTFTSSDVRCAFARGSHTLLCLVVPPRESDYGSSSKQIKIVAIDIGTASPRELVTDMAYSNFVFMKTSPDGKYLAYPASTGPETQEVFVVEIATGKRMSLGVSGRYEHVVGWLH